MKIQKILFTCMMLCSIIRVEAQAFSEEKFKPENYFDGIDPIATKRFNLGESITREAIQLVINKATSEGIKIIIPSGVHRFQGITVNKNNIHIIFEQGVTILPPDKNTPVFRIGSRSGIENDSKGVDPIKNVKISGKGIVTINYEAAGKSNIKAFLLENVTNFMISNIKILAKFPVSSGITLSSPPTNLKIADRFRAPIFNKFPTKGVLQNIEMQGANSGYGLIQVQGAKSILFKNLTSTGGIALRLENGGSTPAGSNFSTISELYAENINCIKGNFAVLLAPHIKNNGRVQLRNINANDCSFAIRSGPGFIDKKVPSQIKELIQAGTFTPAPLIGNVSATKTEKGFAASARLAKVDNKNYAFYPRAVTTQTPFSSLEKADDASPSRFAVPGGGIVVSSQLSENEIGPKKEGFYKVSIVGNVNLKGEFQNSEEKEIYKKSEILYRKDNGRVNIPEKDENSLIAAKDYDSPNTEIYYDMNKKILNLFVSSIANLSIYNLSGILLKEQTLSKGNQTVNLSNFDSGVYLVNINHNYNSHSKKIVIK
ncbi:T9SS type A sorting domain-containing protein [Aquimarina algicola]|uniref:T9SS type A sorting domain-containing protein n=1 Tax=Aquimarina algicola TaxID=2589995 RepID=A0A504J1E8_9FLAO|nr:T9SS type A sorting domain-containing protein [Aquimarina algicola]TPN82435.1 T9SS type A sorting domain-containing protein [Aquimarina algicola]